MYVLLWVMLFQQPKVANKVNLMTAHEVPAGMAWWAYEHTQDLDAASPWESVFYIRMLI